MIRGRMIMLLLILGLWCSCLVFAQEPHPGVGNNVTSCGPILDAGPAFQQDRGNARTVLGWPEPWIFVFICNYPPARPLMPAGNASGILAAGYNYITSAIDPDGDQIAYTFDWGDGTTSESGPVDSGTALSANHTWSRAGIYQIRARAKDSRKASSAWSEPLTVIINTPPNSPSTPSGPESGRPGTSYTYALSAADPDGDRLNYTLDWGDGTASITAFAESGAAISANHTWSRAGAYRIRAQVVDAQGAASAWSEPLAVMVNAPPNSPSRPSGPSSGMPGELQTYTASATDPDGDRLNYTLDWGDGTASILAFVQSGTAASADHTWDKSGMYQIRAQATDSRGASSGWSESRTVVINAPPGNPSPPAGPESAYAWASYRYSTSASDPDGDPVKYLFDWGDGNTSATDSVKSGSSVSAMHAWSQAGTYQIRVMATDWQGDSSEWSRSLNVTVIANNRPNSPQKLFGLSSSYTGVERSYFTLAKDPDNDRVSYTFYWGDGTISTTDQVKSGSIESAPHEWRSAGIYQVQAMAMDSKGASSGRARLFNITIADNDPPHTPAMPSGPTSGRIMGAYKYSAYASDPDGDRVKYVFDWGDGTTSWTGLDFIASGTVASVFHQWSRAGRYRIKAMAMDDKGASSGWSEVLVVEIS